MCPYCNQIIKLLSTDQFWQCPTANLLKAWVHHFWEFTDCIGINWIKWTNLLMQIYRVSSYQHSFILYYDKSFSGFNWIYSTTWNFSKLFVFIKYHSAIFSTFQWTMAPQFKMTHVEVSLNESHSLFRRSFFPIEINDFHQYMSGLSIIWNMKLHNNRYEVIYSTNRHFCSIPIRVLPSKIDWMMTFYRWVKYAFCLNCNFYPKNSIEWVFTRMQHANIIANVPMQLVHYQCDRDAVVLFSLCSIYFCIRTAHKTVQDQLRLWLAQ